MKQDPLRYCDGKYPESDWIGHFLIDDNCFAFGIIRDENPVSVILGEKLTFGGCILWYIATNPDDQGMGYGSELLKYFENHMKKIGIEWIFLNASENSLNFYNKHKYVTSEFSKVYEHVKDL